MTVERTGQKEIGRGNLSGYSGSRSLPGQPWNDRHKGMDERKRLRTFYKTGIRFYHFYDNWPEFERLINKADKFGGGDNLIEREGVAGVLLRLRIGFNNADSGVFRLPPEKEEMFSCRGFA